MPSGIEHIHQYIDEREKLDYMLTRDEDVLFRWLGERDFLVERDGHYNPRSTLKGDFISRGKRIFEKHAKPIESIVSFHWRQMRQSGLLGEMKDIYAVLLGVLLGRKVYYALAVVISAIMAKRLNSQLIKEPDTEDLSLAMRRQILEDMAEDNARKAAER